MLITPVPITIADEPDDYTGLKDKNGKEIYEGDIVQNVPFDRPCDFREIKNILPPDREYRDFVDNVEHFPESWEVIGNIYESPELLKED